MTEVNDYTKSMQLRLMANGFSVGADGADGKMGPSTLTAANAAFDKAGLMAVAVTQQPKPPADEADAPMSSVRVTISDLWMPAASMKRIIMHWTAGSYVASELDLEHYHFIIDGNGVVHRGEHSVKDNEVIHGNDYAAHTLGTNTGSIGVSVCAMAGAIETPFEAGKYPIKPAQFDVLLQVVVQLAKRYSIPVTRQTILSHAEVQQTLGIKQRGKWDIARLPFDSRFVGGLAVGDHIRSILQGES